MNRTLCLCLFGGGREGVSPQAGRKDMNRDFGTVPTPLPPPYLTHLHLLVYLLFYKHAWWYHHWDLCGMAFCRTGHDRLTTPLTVDSISQCSEHRQHAYLGASLWLVGGHCCSTAISLTCLPTMPSLLLLYSWRSVFKHVCLYSTSGRLLQQLLTSLPSVDMAKLHVAPPP